MPKTFYIIDGHAQIYRAFYAPFRDLTSPTGEPTRATHVFCSMLFNLIRDRKPDYLAMALDVDDHSVFRTKIDPNYKAHRDPSPEGLDVQADRIVSIVQALGIPTFRLSGFEADDLMATMAERVKGEDVHVYFVSKDKDLEQLMSDRVSLFDVGKGEVLTPETLTQVKGYTPAQALEVQNLAGDSTDNIPGIAGVGVKTAAKLVQQYGSAAAVIEHADELAPKLAEKVKAFAGQLPITRQLVTLRRDVEFPFELAQCRLERLNVPAARPIFQELGFTRLREQLESFASPSEFTTGSNSLWDRLSGPSDRLESRSHSAQLPCAVPSPTTRFHDYRLIDTPAAFEEFLTKLAAQKVFAFDTETTGLNPIAADLCGMSFSWHEGEGYYLPVRGTMGPLLNQPEVIAKLKPLLEDPAIGKVGHNIKYDLQVMRVAGVRMQGLVFDTMIADSLLEPNRSSHGLDALSRIFFNYDKIPTSDLLGKGKNQITFAEVDTRRAGEYAAEDADFTWRLYQALAPRMRGSHVEPLFRDTEMPLVEVLAEMEFNGMSLDSALLAKLGEEMHGRLVELTKRIHAAAGRTFNIESPKQLGEILFDELGLTVVRKTKTGRSTDAETLETLAGQTDHPVPRLILEYRELAKLKNTYIDTLPTMVTRRTGRLHASFHQTGAITGRLSSSDPNLQNIPIRTETGKRIREAFIADSPDHTLLIADYSQIELRLLAHFCQDPALMAAFREGQDIHRAVAAQVNNVPIDAVTSAQRSAAKAVNFGIIYGQTPFGLAKSLGITQTDAKTFIETYFARYPGIRRFIDKCVADAREKGYAETILGRRRAIDELQSRNPAQRGFGERIAVNTVVQGSAADLIKRAMIDVHSAIQRGELPVKMLIQVHDELVFEVPEAELEEAKATVRRLMENALPVSVPIVVDVGSGRNWAEAK